VDVAGYAINRQSEDTHRPPLPATATAAAAAADDAAAAAAADAAMSLHDNPFFCSDSTSSSSASALDVGGYAMGKQSDDTHRHRPPLPTPREHPDWGVMVWNGDGP